MKTRRSLLASLGSSFVRSPGKTRGHSRRGAATVELALCLPLITGLTLGICELGQALKVEAVLSGAARFACATACRPGCSNTDVIEDAKSILSANKIPTNSATITIKVNDQTGNVLTAAANAKISVTVSIPISQVNWTNTRQYFGANSTLSQTVVMARQG
ncbi:MAG TPA: TadE/TadG family type IV pilus assembly protein [Planctomycetaceae bacterium]|nr:TadE/TadG family type IV pilus assembly protein [Planctomycetaceae bacterium]